MNSCVLSFNTYTDLSHNLFKVSIDSIYTLLHTDEWSVMKEGSITRCLCRQPHRLKSWIDALIFLNILFMEWQYYSQQYHYIMVAMTTTLIPIRKCHWITGDGGYYTNTISLRWPSEEYFMETFTLTHLVLKTECSRETRQRYITADALAASVEEG